MRGGGVWLGVAAEAGACPQQTLPEPVQGAARGCCLSGWCPAEAPPPGKAPPLTP